MIEFQFDSAAALLQGAKRHGMTLSEFVIRCEAQRDETDPETVLCKMRESFSVMQKNIEDGIVSGQPSIGGLIGQNAKKMHAYTQRADALGGTLMSRAVSYSLAVTEENARMKRIVACPTAGASGVVPGCVLAYCELHGLESEEAAKALCVASAIGVVIALRASLSGAQAGCQAEVGTAAAMAAAALCELVGGDAQACLHASAMALKNMLGLVCDPVAGLVEVPCSKRNAAGVAVAIAAADMALAGIESVIPLDEVIEAMMRVGQSMPVELRETAKGGVAATKTGIAIDKQMRSRTQGILADE